MPFVTEALRRFRRRALEHPTQAVLPAVFVLEPDMYLASAVVASWYPVATLQLLGATGAAATEARRATLGHAIAALGARTVVVCAEGSGQPNASGAADALLAGCTAVRQDPALGSAAGAPIVTEALWFDVVEGDLYRWSPSARRFELLADDALSRFLEEVKSRAA
jgi:hypothetical protein